MKKLVVLLFVSSLTLLASCGSKPSDTETTAPVANPAIEDAQGTEDQVPTVETETPSDVPTTDAGTSNEVPTANVGTPSGTPTADGTTPSESTPDSTSVNSAEPGPDAALIQ